MQYDLDIVKKDLKEILSILHGMEVNRNLLHMPKDAFKHMLPCTTVEALEELNEMPPDGLQNLVCVTM